MSTLIRIMQKTDLDLIYTTPAFTGGGRTRDLYKRYYEEQGRDERVVIIASHDGRLAGHVSVIWKSEYPSFSEKGIPEINDLLVIPDLRRRGIATALVDKAEKHIFKRSPVAGIGVGLYADYGPAQRMYVLRGYIPDRLGLMYKNIPVKPGEMVRVDDDLVLFLTKERPKNQ